MNNQTESTNRSKETKKPLADTSVFLKLWLKDPYSIGAVAPSSHDLAKIITSGVSSDLNTVIELGGGSGRFTDWILRRGLDPEKLTVFERHPDFYKMLQDRFPSVTINSTSATSLHLCNDIPDHSVDIVISGLPLLGMSSLDKIRIMKRAFKKLKPGGAFYQFTYAFRSPLSQNILQHLSLESSIVGTALINVPPAQVYCYKKLER